jgi:hypothetical protein
MKQEDCILKTSEWIAYVREWLADHHHPANLYLEDITDEMPAYGAHPSTAPAIAFSLRRLGYERRYPRVLVDGRRRAPWYSTVL